MARTARASVGGICYHVLNRGNGRATVFHETPDYQLFARLLGQPKARPTMRVLGFCLMPNHFHLVLWPHADGDLGRWMQWLMTTHVRRHHRVHGSSGHVWQGRFKAFPIQQDDHLLTVLRYVERNPLRAGLVAGAEEWPWSSLALRLRSGQGDFLARCPVPLPGDWRGFVNLAQTSVEVDRLRRGINRGAPFGDAEWTPRTAAALGLQSSLRPRGRPRKAAEGDAKAPKRPE